ADESLAWLAADRGWLATAEREGAAPARLVTASRVLATAAEKAALFRRAGGGMPIALDMEAAGWGRAGSACGVPWAIVRVVYDTSDEDLPPFLARCLGADGRVSRTKVAAWAASHPRVVPSLLGMRRRLGVQANLLADVVSRLLAASR